MAWTDSTIAIWWSMTSTLGGPLLAVFLLGMFTRRTTATAALTALIAGTACSTWLLTANHSEAFSGLWPGHQKLPGGWSLTLGFLFSLAWGYLGSWVLGERKSHDQLRGLVAGIGAWGICRPEASIAIPDSFETVEEGTVRGRPNLTGPLDHSRPLGLPVRAARSAAPRIPGLLVRGSS